MNMEGKGSCGLFDDFRPGINQARCGTDWKGTSECGFFHNVMEYRQKFQGARLFISFEGEKVTLGKENSRVSALPFGRRSRSCTKHITSKCTRIASPANIRWIVYQLWVVQHRGEMRCSSGDLSCTTSTWCSRM